MSVEWVILYTYYFESYLKINRKIVPAVSLEIRLKLLSI